MKWWKEKNWEKGNINDLHLWRTRIGNVWKLEKERGKGASFGSFVANTWKHGRADSLAMLSLSMVI